MDTSNIDDTIKALNKEFGDNTISTFGDKEAYELEIISTNSYALDHVLGCNGLPRGRIIELYGAESSGKSTLAMFLAAQVQKNGGKVFWLDAECSFSRKYAENVGVDTTNLILAQPTTGEEGLKMVRKMVGTNEIDLVVVDSVASLVPARELAGELTDAEMAQQARMMSKGLRMLTGTISKTNTVVIFINQTREKVGVYFGKKDTTPGGKALKFYSSLRLQVRRGTSIKNSTDDVIGNVMHISATKNKVGLPFRSCELELYYERGLDLTWDAISWALKYNIVTKTGNTYIYTATDEKMGVGEKQTKDFTDKHPEVLTKIKEEINNYGKTDKKKDDSKKKPKLQEKT